MSSFMRRVAARPPTPRVDATFIVAKDGDRWVFGASRQIIASFSTKDEAIAHAEEIVRRIPDADFAVVEGECIADGP